MSEKSEAKQTDECKDCQDIGTERGDDLESQVDHKIIAEWERYDILILCCF